LFELGLGMSNGNTISEYECSLIIIITYIISLSLNPLICSQKQ
jgi:hypothetical protein